MPTITIDIDEVSNQFYLKGDTLLFVANKRALLNIKDAFDPLFDNQKGEIIIGFNKDNKEDRLEKIQKLLLKYNFTEKRTEKVEHELKDFLRLNKEFEDFSQHSYRIRNNQYNAVDFKAFSEVLLEKIRRPLYPYQLLSAYHLAFSQNACNFSVPGAGKTSVVYGAFAYLNSLPQSDPKFVSRLMVIGPLASFGPWEDEFEACFGRASRSKRIVAGISDNDRRTYFLSSKPADITLISYQGVPGMLEGLKTFLKLNKVMVVLDEAHKIKNIDGGVIADAVLSLSRFCRSRVVLTGTPAPNGYEDLFNLYDFIWPNKNITGSKNYLKRLTQSKSISSAVNVSELINKIAPFFIRVRKKDLPGLPRIVNHPAIQTEMGETQKIIYNFIEQKYFDYLINNPREQDIKSKFTRARMIRLMQCATNPEALKAPLENYLFEEEDEVVLPKKELFIDDSIILKQILNYERVEVPAKFTEIEIIIREIIARNEKVIVWTTFISTIKSLSLYLKSKGIENELLYGEVPVERENIPEDIRTREKIIKEFHKRDSFKVIIANPFAVSESISLHRASNNAIYLDRTFNAAQFIQSKDRIHRVGLNNPDAIVNYYFIISNNTIDEVINRRLEEKEKRMLEIIESQPIPLIDDNNDLEQDQIDDLKILINDYVQRSRKA
jgi:SNF2 family DNA or RNA helicase